MPGMNVQGMRDQAQLILDEAEARLAQLRAEKVNIQAAIKETVKERDEAKSIVKKLTPRQKKEAVVVDVEDEIDVLSEATVAV